MTKKIFISLPVTDLPASTAFYKALGFEQNAQFSDDTAACMAWSFMYSRDLADPDGHLWAALWMAGIEDRG